MLRFRNIAVSVAWSRGISTLRDDDFDVLMTTMMMTMMM